MKGIVKGAFIFLLIVGGIALLGFTGFIPFLTFPGGLTVTGIIPPSVNFGIWGISATTTSGGVNTIVGTLTPEQTQALTEGSEQTEFPLTIGITSQSEELVYDVLNTQNPIISLEVAQSTTSLFTTCSQEFGGDWDWTLKPPLQTGLPPGITGLCVRQVQSATFGQFTNPLQIRSAEVTVSRIVSGTPQPEIVATISNLDTSASLGVAGTVQAIDLGITGTPLPPIQNFVPYFDNDQQEWKTAFETSVDFATGNLAPLQLQLDEWEGTPFLDFNDIIPPLNNYNSVVESVLVQDVPVIANGVWEYDATGPVELRGTLPPEAFTTSLNILFSIDADWIGVLTATGQPNIVSATSPQFEAGTGQGVLTLIVQNIAPGPGVFVVTLTECPFIFQQTFNEFPFAGGETKTLQLPITSQNPQEICQECSITVKDKATPTNLDTTNIILCQSAATSCTEGETGVFGLEVFVCENGLFVSSDICDFGVVFENGEWRCAESGEGAIEPGPPVEDFDFVTIIIILAIITVVVSIGVKAVKK